jgi:deoxyribodipyrimidine photo-lyase
MENPGAPAIFVFDQPFLESTRIAFARLQFMFEGAIEALSDRDHRVCVGTQALEITRFARERGCTEIHTTQISSPELDHTLAVLEQAGFKVITFVPDRLTAYNGRVKRFSTFWREVEREVLG